MVGISACQHTFIGVGSVRRIEKVGYIWLVFKAPLGQGNVILKAGICLETYFGLVMKYVGWQC